jgi:hypothetical protein
MKAMHFYNIKKRINWLLDIIILVKLMIENRQILENYIGSSHLEYLSRAIDVQKKKDFNVN